MIPRHAAAPLDDLVVEDIRPVGLADWLRKASPDPELFNLHPARIDPCDWPIALEISDDHTRLGRWGFFR